MPPPLHPLYTTSSPQRLRRHFWATAVITDIHPRDNLITMFPGNLVARSWRAQTVAVYLTIPSQFFRRYRVPKGISLQHNAHKVRGFAHNQLVALKSANAGIE